MYVPILKNRTIEMSVIRTLVAQGLHESTIPLFEIIQEKSRSNTKKTYIDELKEIFSNNESSFFLDFPKLDITASTSKSVQEFVVKVNRQRSFVAEQFKLCKGINGIIPVVSFRKKDVVPLGKIAAEIAALRPEFERIALRLTPAQTGGMKDFASYGLSDEDYFFLDIDDNNHTNPVFSNIYQVLVDAKSRRTVKTIIINSHRPTTLLNKNISDNEPIQEIDNSLLGLYSSSPYQFDGFSDYASITNALPTSGGSITPAGIYYSYAHNYFVGFRGRGQSLDEFQNHIAPSIIKSSYWDEFDENHHNTCPGCKKIQEIVHGESSGKSQGLWKGITMGHYIYSLDENLG